MAGKKTAGNKRPARKKQGNLKDLSSPGQELSERQAAAVKGGTGDTNRLPTENIMPAFGKIKWT